ncbi:MAG: Gfo/Idh/MocA family oxidoreductase [Oscillospiraceae bacterium]|nr:Gfo/Idh/MocA family oxidoreductase [Oscillospiraceae bacterium]
MKFKIIMVGCGVMANHWLNSITPKDDCEIIALADLDIGRAKAAREKYSLECRVYSSVDEALEAESGNLLIDLTYVTMHHDVTIKALRAGYDVIGEKPMAFEPNQANDMLRAAAETGKRYIVAQNRRYIGQVEKIRDIVISKKIGEPVFICAEIFVSADMASIRNQLEYPQLQDNNIHAFDMARYMANGNPISAYYHSFNPKGSKYVGDAACAAIFEFDNGAVFEFRGYNGAEGCHTTWNNSWRVLCERGTILWDGNPENDAFYEYAEQTGVYAYQKETLKKPDVIRDPNALEVEDFLDALSTGRTPSTDCKDNIHSIAMVFASVKSIREGRKVAIEVNETYPYIVLN